MTDLRTHDRTEAAGASVDAVASSLAERLASLRAGRTVCCAESFTAGVLGQTLASIESSGDWFEGAVVAYRTVQKRSVLGVSEPSVVSESCAVQMALGAAALFRAEIALSTTGVAGPTTQEGWPPGTVIVAWVVGEASGARTLRVDGAPDHVIVAGVRAALAEVAAALDPQPVGADDAAPGGG